MKRESIFIKSEILNQIRKLKDQNKIKSITSFVEESVNNTLNPNFIKEKELINLNGHNIFTNKLIEVFKGDLVINDIVFRLNSDGWYLLGVISDIGRTFFHNHEYITVSTGRGDNYNKDLCLCDMDPKLYKFYRLRGGK